MANTQNYHPSHPDHELELKNFKKPFTCDGCKEQGYGPRYRCEECDYDLHKDCMFYTPTTSHEFFEGSTFKFFNQTPGKYSKRRSKRITYCDACGKAVNGFVYHCEEDNLDLHPCCRNLENKLCIGDAKFRFRNEVLSKCSLCNNRTVQGSSSDVRGWSYVSECGEYHFHVHCATAMVIENWKTIGNKDENCLAIENLKLHPLQRRSKRNGGGGKYWRIVKIFLKTIACILLGDPVITLTSLMIDLVT